MKIFVIKIFVLKNFRTLTPLQIFLYNEIFLTKKELVRASSIHSTTAEEYQHQSKQVRSRLPHEANIQYGGGILEWECYVRVYFPTSKGLYLCTNKGVAWSYTDYL